MYLSGIALLVVGFVAGAMASVVHVDRIEVLGLALAWGTGAAGVALMRYAKRREATAPERLQANYATLKRHMNQILERASTLRATPDTVYEIPRRLEQELAEPIAGFLEARQALMAMWGVQAYADIMSHFSAGERYLNRVWSAASDGYIDECRTYLERAAKEFKVAEQHFQRLSQESAQETSAKVTASVS